MKMKKQTKKEFSAHEKNLKRLGQYDEDFATWLVENAIAGDYQGCIFPDTATVYAKWLKTKQDGGENFNKKMSFTDFQNMPTAAVFPTGQSYPLTGPAGTTPVQLLFSR